MTSSTESCHATSISSPALARLFRSYKHYLIDAIRDRNPIVPIEKFYRLQLRLKEINRSRIFEQYLNEVKPMEIHDGI